MRIGLLVFEAAEELDVVGPYQVLTTAAKMIDDAALTVELVAAREGVVRCANGLRLVPDAQIGEVPRLDVVIVPGGEGRVEACKDEALLQWLVTVAGSARKVVSICTGVMLLERAGLVQGRRVTTHHSYAEELASTGTCLVLSGCRFVEDGDVLSSAGISSGIDASLRLVEILFGSSVRARVARELEWPDATL